MYKLDRTDPKLSYKDGKDGSETQVTLNTRSQHLVEVVLENYTEGMEVIGRIGEFKTTANASEVVEYGRFKVRVERFIEQFNAMAHEFIRNSVVMYMTIFKFKAILFLGDDVQPSEIEAVDLFHTQDPARVENKEVQIDILRALEYALLGQDGWIDSTRLTMVQHYYPEFKLIQLTNSTDPQGLDGENRISMVTFVWCGIKFRYDRRLQSSSLKASLSRVQKL